MKKQLSQRQAAEMARVALVLSGEDRKARAKKRREQERAMEREREAEESRKWFAGYKLDMRVEGILEDWRERIELEVAMGRGKGSKRAGRL